MMLPTPTMTATIDRGLVTVTFDSRPKPRPDTGERPPRRHAGGRRAGAMFRCSHCHQAGHQINSSRCPGNAAPPIALPEDRDTSAQSAERFLAMRGKR